MKNGAISLAKLETTKNVGCKFCFTGHGETHSLEALIFLFKITFFRTNYSEF